MQKNRNVGEIAYTKTETIPFATLSDNLEHGPCGIWAHMEPVIKYMNTRHEFKTLHFVSDGLTPHYRSKFNLYLFTTQMFKKGYLKGTCNFLESSHGKGAADGVGAVVKRTADKRVETNGSDITCAEDLAHELKDLNVKVFIVKGEEIDRLAEKIPKDLKSIHDIMTVHQVIRLFVTFKTYTRLYLNIKPQQQ
jgi:hypothetical protein